MASRKWKKIQHRFEYIIVLVLIHWVQKISVQHALRLGGLLGKFVFSVLRIRRTVVLENLAAAFPMKSGEERLDIARRTYQNFGKMVIEFLRIPVTDDERLLSMAQFVGAEHLESVRNKEKGAVLVSGHFGNWEIMAAAVSKLGYPISSVAAWQNNRLVDELINNLRESTGNRVIRLGVAVRGVIRALRNNEFVALLADQDAGKDGLFIDFLGRPASVHTGPAIFALKTGAPVIFGVAIRMPGGRHRFVIEELDFSHLKGLTEKNIREVAETYTRRLEKAIRQYPDHWFWMHRRWKTKMPDSDQ